MVDNAVRLTIEAQLSTENLERDIGKLASRAEAIEIDAVVNIDKLQRQIDKALSDIQKTLTIDVGAGRIPGQAGRGTVPAAVPNSQENTRQFKEINSNLKRISRQVDNLSGRIDTSNQLLSQLVGFQRGERVGRAVGAIAAPVTATAANIREVAIQTISSSLGEVIGGIGSTGIRKGIDRALGPVIGNTELLAERGITKLIGAAGNSVQKGLDKLSELEIRELPLLNEEQKKNIQGFVDELQKLPAGIRANIKELVGSQDIAIAVNASKALAAQEEETKKLTAAEGVLLSLREQSRLAIDRAIAARKQLQASAQATQRGRALLGATTRATTGGATGPDIGLIEALIEPSRKQLEANLVAIGKQIDLFTRGISQQAASLQRQGLSEEEIESRLEFDLKGLENLGDARNEIEATLAAFAEFGDSRQVSDKLRGFLDDIVKNLIAQAERARAGAGRLARGAVTAREAAGIRRQQIQALTAGDTPEIVQRILRTLTGRVQTGQGVPRIRVADEILRRRGANAAFSPEANEVLITEELGRAIRENSLTEPQMETLIHELEHTVQTGMGRLEGFLERRQGGSAVELAVPETDIENRIAEIVAKAYIEAGQPEKVPTEIDAVLTARRRLPEIFNAQQKALAKPMGMPALQERFEQQQQKQEQRGLPRKVFLEPSDELLSSFKQLKNIVAELKIQQSSGSVGRETAESFIERGIEARRIGRQEIEQIPTEERTTKEAQAIRNVQAQIGKLVAQGKRIVSKELNLDLLIAEIPKGIQEGFEGVSVEESIRTVSDDIKNAFQDEFEISSPSRWAERVIGEGIIAGILNALSRGRSEINKEIEDLRNQATIAASPVSVTDKEERLARLLERVNRRTPTTGSILRSIETGEDPERARQSFANLRRRAGRLRGRQLEVELAGDLDPANKQAGEIIENVKRLQAQFAKSSFLLEAEIDNKALEEGDKVVSDFNETLEQFNQTLEEYNEQASLIDDEVDFKNILKVDIDREIGEELTRIGDFAGKVAEKFKGIGLAILGVVAAIPLLKPLAEFLVNIAGEALESARSIDRLRAALAFADVRDTTGVINNLIESSNRLGISFATAASNYRQLLFSFQDTALESQTATIFEGISAGLAARQATTEQQNRALTAVAQIAQKNVLQAEEVRQQLAEALPGSVQTLARSQGLTTRELSQAIERGQLGTAEEVLPRFAEELRREAEIPILQFEESNIRRLNEFVNQLELTKISLGELIKPFDTISLQIRTLGLDALGAGLNFVRENIIGIIAVLGIIATQSLAAIPIFNPVTIRTITEGIQALGVTLQGLARNLISVIAITEGVQLLIKVFNAGSEEIKTLNKQLDATIKKLGEVGKENPFRQISVDNIEISGNALRDLTALGEAENRQFQELIQARDRAFEEGQFRQGFLLDIQAAGQLLNIFAKLERRKGVLDLSADTRQITDINSRTTELIRQFQQTINTQAVEEAANRYQELSVEIENTQSRLSELRRQPAGPGAQQEISQARAELDDLIRRRETELQDSFGLSPVAIDQLIQQQEAIVARLQDRPVLSIVEQGELQTAQSALSVLVGLQEQYNSILNTSVNLNKQLTNAIAESAVQSALANEELNKSLSLQRLQLKELQAEGGLSQREAREIEFGIQAEGIQSQADLIEERIRNITEQLSTILTPTATAQINNIFRESGIDRTLQQIISSGGLTSETIDTIISSIEDLRKLELSGAEEQILSLLGTLGDLSQEDIELRISEAELNIERFRANEEEIENEIQKAIDRANIEVQIQADTRQQQLLQRALAEGLEREDIQPDLEVISLDESLTKVNRSIAIYQDAIARLENEFARGEISATFFNRKLLETEGILAGLTRERAQIQLDLPTPRERIRQRITADIESNLEEINRVGQVVDSVTQGIATNFERILSVTSDLTDARKEVFDAVTEGRTQAAEANISLLEQIKSVKENLSTVTDPVERTNLSKELSALNRKAIEEIGRGFSGSDIEAINKEIARQQEEIASARIEALQAEQQLLDKQIESERIKASLAARTAVIEAEIAKSRAQQEVAAAAIELEAGDISVEEFQGLQDVLNLLDERLAIARVEAQALPELFQLRERAQALRNQNEIAALERETGRQVGRRTPLRDDTPSVLQRIQRELSDIQREGNRNLVQSLDRQATRGRSIRERADFIDVELQAIAREFGGEALIEIPQSLIQQLTERGFDAQAEIARISNIPGLGTEGIELEFERLLNPQLNEIANNTSESTSALQKLLGIEQGREAAGRRSLSDSVTSRRLGIGSNFGVGTNFGASLVASTPTFEQEPILSGPNVNAPLGELPSDATLRDLANRAANPSNTVNIQEINIPITTPSTDPNEIQRRVLDGFILELENAVNSR